MASLLPSCGQDPSSHSPISHITSYGELVEDCHHCTNTSPRPSALVVLPTPDGHLPLPFVPSSLPIPTPPDVDSTLSPFPLERGFWRVQHGARELLRFSSAYHQFRDALRRVDTPLQDALPSSIDMVAMTQLSRGILHAVGDIKTHQRRVAETKLCPGDGEVHRHNEGQRPHGKAHLRAKDKKNVNPAPSTGCNNCSRLESPRWRRGPEGLRTLCNVCGLLYAKRAYREKLKFQSA